MSGVQWRSFASAEASPSHMFSVLATLSCVTRSDVLLLSRSWSRVEDVSSRMQPSFALMRSLFEDRWMASG